MEGETGAMVVEAETARELATNLVLLKVYIVLFVFETVALSVSQTTPNS